MSEIVGWLALTVISGLLFAVGSLVDWKAALAKYLPRGENSDRDQQ